MPASAYQFDFQTDSCTVDSLFAYGGYTSIMGFRNTIRYIYSAQNFIISLTNNHFQFAEIRGYTRFENLGSSDFDTLYLHNAGSIVSLDPNVTVTINNKMYTASNPFADLITINSLVA